MEKSKLKQLKQDYARVQRQYALPDFSQLNEEFDIEKIAEKETELLLREVRRAIGEKVVSFLKFFELFMHPAGAPLFILTALKGLDAKTKDLIEKVYKELVKLELVSISLDTEYSEKNEAQFIKDAMQKWCAIRDDIKSVNEALGEAWDIDELTNKDYMG